MIIDIHAHTSTHNMRGLHVVKADLEDLHQYAEQFSISKIYLMATSFPLKGTGLSNQDLLQRVRDDKLFGAFGTLDVSKNDFGEIMDLIQLAANGFLDGIKLYPGYQNFVLCSPANDWLYLTAERHGLPVAVHLGELHHCCPQESRVGSSTRCGRESCPLDQLGYLAHPDRLAEVARNFPKVKFIACHLANPCFADLRKVMIECPNIYTDISGQFVSGTAEDTPEYRREVVSEIKQFLQLPGGVERIMFATDFPIQSYQDTFDLVDALGLSPVKERLLLSENALRILPKRK